jgi:hypothetical protein
MIRRLIVLLGVATAGWYLYTRLRPRPAAEDWDVDEVGAGEASGIAAGYGTADSVHSPAETPEAERPTDAASPSSAPAGAEPVTDRGADGGAVAVGEVKGNIRSDGEQIYHLPGDPAYERTHAEQTFASAEEAEAAGFRRAGHRSEEVRDAHEERAAQGG